MRISDLSSDVCSSDLLSGYQALGSSAEILVDAYYADRDGDQWIQSSLVSKTLQSTGAKSRGINPALLFYLPNEMSLRFYGAFGKNESRYGNNFLSLDTGLQTQIGSAPCRERVSQEVNIPVVAQT